MDKKGIGVDIVELYRIRGIAERGRFVELAFTARERAELAKYTDHIAFIASRFAVKEAVIKAFPLPLTMQDFEIRKRGVKPYVHFFTPGHQKFRAHISLSHSVDYAAGYAHVEKI